MPTTRANFWKAKLEANGGRDRRAVERLHAVGWRVLCVWECSTRDAKVGAVNDVLVDKSGKITALIVGVGGFLGAGEKDVAVPFDAVRVTTKDNNKWYLVMNATKDGLKASPGYKYDRGMTTWVPDTK